MWGIFGGALPGISPSIAMALLLPFTYGLDPLTAIVLLACGLRRRRVRRLDPGDPDPHAGHERRGGDDDRRLRDAPAGPGRARARHLAGRGLRRRPVRPRDAGVADRAARRAGARVHAARVFRARRTRPERHREPVRRLAAEGAARRRLLGLMVATVGTDPLSGVSRFTFGVPDLLGGIKPILVMIGLFAVSELIVAGARAGAGTSVARRRAPAAARLEAVEAPVECEAIGCAIGTVEGVTPGAGGTIAAFLSYNEAKRWSKHPEEFGHGSPEGVAAPECANNVVTGTALVPLLSLGIPGSNSAAVLLGGFLVHGLMPGPMLFERTPGIAYGLYGGLFVANIAMLLIGLVILTPCIWLVNRPQPVPDGVRLRAGRLRRFLDRAEPVRRRHRARRRRPRLRDAMPRRADPADGARRGAGLHGRVELPPLAAALRRRSDDLPARPDVAGCCIAMAVALLRVALLARTASRMRQRDHQSVSPCAGRAHRAASRRPTYRALVRTRAEEMLLDVAGLCVAARQADYVERAARRAGTMLARARRSAMRAASAQPPPQ